MLAVRSYIKLLAALTLTSASFFSASALGQVPAAPQGKEVAAAQGPKLDNSQPAASAPKGNKPENKVADDQRRSDDVQNDVAALKAENAAVRELLRKMEEQQRVLLEQVDRLQRRLDGAAMAAPTTGAVENLSPVPDAQGANAANGMIPGSNIANTPGTATTPADPSSQSAPAAGKKAEDDSDNRYRDGMVIWQTKDDAKVPFLLRFNVNTQIRYLNTLSSKDTFTDHLGVVREVHNRNDITVNRAMFILAGYVFNPKLQYSFTAWTSAGAASIVLAGNVGWRFNKALTITGGYTGVPGSRSLVGTFPFFAPIDRSMADNFFRPGFTQGVWANGELGKGVSYLAFVGNGLNTLNISANKIDTNLLVAGSVWWEPLGRFSEPGKSRNMYDDYFDSKKVRIRIGSSFTRSREDRFSETDQATPDNTAIFNSDGVNAFSTGAFAPGVTVNKSTYKMWAIDGGLKWNGFAINGQYYFRWLNHFDADGPMPLASTFDHGFELSAGKFLIPKKLVVYGRGSAVFGQFNTPYEYGGGFKWYFLPTERIWMNGEVMRVNHSPYGGAFTPYTAGMNGWVPMLQTILAF